MASARLVHYIICTDLLQQNRKKETMWKHFHSIVTLLGTKRSLLWNGRPALPHGEGARWALLPRLRHFCRDAPTGAPMAWGMMTGIRRGNPRRSRHTPSMPLPWMRRRSSPRSRHPGLHRQRRGPSLHPGLSQTGKMTFIHRARPTGQRGTSPGSADRVLSVRALTHTKKAVHPSRRDRTHPPGDGAVSPPGCTSCTRDDGR